MFENFKEFNVLVERKLINKLKHVHTDINGEYYGSFDVYFKHKGITHETTPPKTPKLDGLAKRMNQTLVKKMICMLSKFKLPKHY